MNETTKIEPMIEDGKVTSIKINDVKHYVDGDWDVQSFLNEIYPAISKVLKVFPQLFKNKEECLSENELSKFLWETHRSNEKNKQKQRVFLSIMIDNHSITKLNLLNKMKKILNDDDFKITNLAGTTAAVSRFTNKMNKKQIFRIKSNLYKLTEEYMLIIRKVLTHGLNIK
jgi:hypothetical protein